MVAGLSVLVCLCMKKEADDEKKYRKDDAEMEKPLDMEKPEAEKDKWGSKESRVTQSVNSRGS